MKPTPQVSSNQHSWRRDGGAAHEKRSFPLTDCFFQSTVDAGRSASGIRLEKSLRAFRNLSGDFFGGERRLDYAFEFLFFAVITAISAWPIISAMVAVTRLVRNY
jgi:hypothetical protein